MHEWKLIGEFMILWLFVTTSEILISECRCSLVRTTPLRLKTRGEAFVSNSNWMSLGKIMPVLSQSKLSLSVLTLLQHQRC